MDTPQPEPIPIGAHLTTPRRAYVHHGVYAGQGRVIHYGGFAAGWRAAPVQEVPIDVFARGRGVTVISRPAQAFDGATIVRRARSRLGENRYHLLRNNCEHFVEWCIADRPASRQVERWMRPLKRLAGALPRLPRGAVGQGSAA